MVGRLGRAFFDRPVLEVAPELLGCTVSHAGVTVRLTEVEAYGGSRDPGSHAFRGRTPRTSVMFGEPGGLYMYFTYGMHWCANLVCGPAGDASAVLLRAGQVIDGLEVARIRRAGFTDRDLARGPARLAMALALSRDQNGVDATATDSPLVVSGEAPRAPVPGGGSSGPSQPLSRVSQPPPPGRRRSMTSEGPTVRSPGSSEAMVGTGPRVGVSGAGGDVAQYPWRFWLEGEATVSTYRPGIVRSRKPAVDASDP